MENIGVTLDKDEIKECELFFNKNKDNKIYLNDFIIYLQDFDIDEFKNV